MPTLLLTFANSETNRLPTLTQECDEVNEALQERFADGDFVVISEPLATRYKIIDLIRAHEENICLFLFSGHAGRDQLVLEDGTGYVDGIAGMLGKCPKLELVILNGCSTAGQVKMLLENGIRAVIATSTYVSDEAATQFSIAFFKELAQERKSIREAFGRAIEAAKVFGAIEEEERSTRGLGLDNEDRPLWGLYYHESQKGRLDTWRLPAPEPVTSATQTGRIVHNIPAKMKKDSRLLCKVRIAKDDEKLLKNFKLPDERTPETLEISKTMEVELVDAGGDVFRIEWILPGKANAEQPIVGHTFTEWIFAVTPLREGEHTLLLCAYFIEKIDGEKTKRTLSFERQVTITTEMDAKEALPQWQLTYITTQGKAEKKKRAGVVGWVTSYAKPLIAAAVLLLSTLFVLNTFTNHSEVIETAGQGSAPTLSVPDESEGEALPDEGDGLSDYNEWVTPILLLNDSLTVDSVFVNGVYLTGWTANADTTELYLTEQTAGLLTVLVRGKNGECRKSANVSGAAPHIQMDCFIRPPVLFRVKAMSRIRATLLVDDTEKISLEKIPPSGRLLPEDYRNIRLYPYYATFTVEKGRHTFKLSHGEEFNCEENEKELTINYNTDLKFDCELVMYKVTIKTAVRPLEILVDGQAVTTVQRVAGDTLRRLPFGRAAYIIPYVSTFFVKKGEHRFKIVSPKGYSCPENSQVLMINKDETLVFQCSKEMVRRPGDRID